MKEKDPPYDEKKYGGSFMRKYRKLIIWGIMLTGFLAGILFIELSGNTYLEKDSFVLQRMLESTQGRSEKTNGYLYFLMTRRGILYLLLAILGQSLGGRIWILLYGAWFCLAEGVLLTSAYVTYHLTGIWVLILLQMPYALCYGMVYVHFVKKYAVQSERRETYAYFKDWICCLPVIMIGILTEYYITPWCAVLLRKWLM